MHPRLSVALSTALLLAACGSGSDDGNVDTAPAATDAGTDTSPLLEDQTAPPTEAVPVPPAVTPEELAPRPDEDVEPAEDPGPETEPRPDTPVPEEPEEAAEPDEDPQPDAEPRPDTSVPEESAVPAPEPGAVPAAPAVTPDESSAEPEEDGDADGDPEPEPEPSPVTPTPADPAVAPPEVVAPSTDAPPAPAPEQEPPTEASTPPPDDPPTLDPTVQDLVRVDVGITVPAHVSNELSVELTWGTKRVVAEWVGDEQWRATVDFPKAEYSGIGFPENRYLLAINFRDGNGDILLGRFEAFFSVREEDAKTYTVVADDFDTGRWDDDSDGVSNIDESRRGTDPRVVDTPVPPESLVASESFLIGGAFLAESELAQGATYFEPSFLELELPMDDRTTVEEGRDTTRTEIDFSADGNGTFRERNSHEVPWDRNAYGEGHGTRSREGNSVTWSGVSWYEGSSIAARRETTFDITSTLDGRELSQRGEGFATSDEFQGKLDFISYRYDIVLDLDSRDADDTCVALRGSIFSVIKFQGDQGTNSFVSSRALSRTSADEPWTWTGIDHEGARIAGEADDVADRFYCGFRFEP